MKILIPLDGSKFAEDILAPAVRLAEGSNGNIEFYLLRVVDDEEAHTTWRQPPPGPGDVGGAWSPSGLLYSPGTLTPSTVETKARWSTGGARRR